MVLRPGGVPVLPGLDAHHPEFVGARAPGEPPAAEHRDRRPGGGEADPPAEEEVEVVAAALARAQHRGVERLAEVGPELREPGVRGNPEAEDARVLDEEVPFFREEQAVARQVDLLQVCLHLGEVGVHGEIKVQPGPEEHLRVHPGVGGGPDPLVGVESALAGLRADIGGDLEAAARLESRESLDRPRIRDAGEVEEPRDRRPEGVFVQAADAAQEVDAPGLLGAFAEAEGLEGDRHLHLPAPRHPPGADMPDAVPVAVELAPLVEDLPVELGAGRVRLEHVAVPPVVEGVEHHAEDVSGAGREITRQVVHDDPLGLVVVGEGPDIEELVVVEHPHFGLEGRRHPLVRVALGEPGGDRRALPLVLVEDAVHLDGPGGAGRRKPPLETRGLEVHRLLGGRRRMRKEQEHGAAASRQEEPGSGPSAGQGPEHRRRRMYHRRRGRTARQVSPPVARPGAVPPPAGSRQGRRASPGRAFRRRSPGGRRRAPPPRSPAAPPARNSSGTPRRPR